MRVGRIVLMLGAIGLGQVSGVAAQDQGRAALAGGIVYSMQESDVIGASGTPGLARPSVAGSAPGFLVNAEFAASRPIWWGVEVSNNARFTSIQTASSGLSGSVKSEDRHRDLIISALVHFRQNLGAYVGLDVMGGASFVQEDTVLQSARTLPSRTYGPYGPEESITRNTA